MGILQVIGIEIVTIATIIGIEPTLTIMVVEQYFNDCVLLVPHHHRQSLLAIPICCHYRITG